MKRSAAAGVFFFVPSFLADPPAAVYLVLLAIAIVTGALAARNQDRRSLIRFSLALAVLLIVHLIDRTNESPYEQAVRRVNAMAEAATAKNPDLFIEHVADSIEYRGGERPVRMTKQELKASPFWPMLRQNDVKAVVWGFSRAAEADDSIEVRFSAKGESSGGTAFLDFTTTFRKQPDGSWKLASFTSYKHQSNELFPLPMTGR